MATIVALQRLCWKNEATALKNEVLLRFRAITEILRKSRTSTADITAAVRAHHQRDRVRIFEGSYAQLLCGGF